MADSTLHIDYAEIKAQVAQLLHGVRDTSGLSADDAANVESLLKTGLRRFYYPQTVNPDLRHEWTFLRPAFDLEVHDGISDYEMPGTFGGCLGSLHFDEDDNTHGPVRKVDEDQIVYLRSYSNSASGNPTCYAERPKAGEGSKTQRWEIMLWPEPDADYTLHGRYRVHPQALTDDQQYAYGGVEHSETILQSCLAAAEQQKGEAGLHTAAFMAALTGSIQFDQSNHRADWLGYNGDRGARRYRRAYEDVATVGGVAYTG